MDFYKTFNRGCVKIGPGPRMVKQIKCSPCTHKSKHSTSCLRLKFKVKNHVSKPHVVHGVSTFKYLPVNTFWKKLVGAEAGLTLLKFSDITESLAKRKGETRQLSSL